MHKYKSTLMYGFAIFAMFFGSGNLVYPLQIGYLSGDNWLLGFLGLLITGILLPFLGLFVIKLHSGSYQSFFNEAGALAGALLPLFTISLLGSFAVVPRCITVAYGSIAYIFPELSLTSFSLIFAVIMFVICFKDQIMINILGKYLSPILLLALTILIIIGLNKSDLPAANSRQAFKEGFLIGYQTMDLFAAFFFSALIFKQIQNSLPKGSSNKTILRIAIGPSIFGASLLALIYLGFTYLGSHYANILVDVAPEAMLPSIAKHILGNIASFFIAITMLFSCLTTAVALNNIYSRYICSTLRIKEDKFWLILLCTTSVAFLVSLLNFQEIAKYLAPILEISYPGLIAITILSICLKLHKKLKIYTFYSITIFMLIRVYLL